MKMAQKKVPKNPEWHKPAGAGSWFPACQRGWHMPGGRIMMPFNHSPSLCGAAIYPCLVRDLLSSLAGPAQWRKKLVLPKPFGS